MKRKKSIRIATAIGAAILAYANGVGSMKIASRKKRAGTWPRDTGFWKVENGELYLTFRGVVLLLAIATVFLLFMHLESIATYKQAATLVQEHCVIVPQPAWWVSP